MPDPAKSRDSPEPMALMGPESANETLRRPYEDQGGGQEPQRTEDLANEDYEGPLEPRHSHRLVENFLNTKIMEESGKVVLSIFFL